MTEEIIIDVEFEEIPLPALPGETTGGEFVKKGQFVDVWA